jgi:hypothetical protein
MEVPIGTEWNTRVGFQRQTLPRVVKKVRVRPLRCRISSLTMPTRWAQSLTHWRRCSDIVPKFLNMLFGSIDLGAIYRAYCMSVPPHMRSFCSGDAMQLVRLDSSVRKPMSRLLKYPPTLRALSSDHRLALALALKISSRVGRRSRRYPETGVWGRGKGWEPKSAVPASGGFAKRAERSGTPYYGNINPSTALRNCSIGRLDRATTPPNSSTDGLP